MHIFKVGEEYFTARSLCLLKMYSYNLETFRTTNASAQGLMDSNQNCKIVHRNVYKVHKLDKKLGEAINDLSMSEIREQP